MIISYHCDSFTWTAKGLKGYIPMYPLFPKLPFHQCHCTKQTCAVHGPCFWDILKAHFRHACVCKSWIQCCLSNEQFGPTSPSIFKLKPSPPLVHRNPLHPILSFSKSTYHLYLHGRIYLLYSLFTLSFDWKAWLWSFFLLNFVHWYFSSFTEWRLTHNRCSINTGGRNWVNDN